MRASMLLVAMLITLPAIAADKPFPPALLKAVLTGSRAKCLLVGHSLGDYDMKQCIDHALIDAEPLFKAVSIEIKTDRGKSCALAYYALWSIEMDGLPRKSDEDFGAYFNRLEKDDAMAEDAGNCMVKMANTP